jgi:hypothetical protein
MEIIGMLMNSIRQRIIFFLIVFLFFSCEKKAVQTAETPNPAVLNGAESVTVGETPELAAENMSIAEKIHNRPVQALEIDYSKDAIENNIDLDDINKVLPIYHWTTEFQFSHIEFMTDGAYLLFTAPEGSEFGAGFYRIDRNEITVDYPSEIWEIGTDLVPKTMEWLFGGAESRVLTYDKTYRDFDVLTCLRFGDKILKNFRIKSPFGEEYELDGFRVIKYHDRENDVLILENLRMRKYPDISAETVTLNRVVDWDPLNLKFATSNIVYARGVHSFDAKTIKTDTIDGITAPWYRISVILNEVFSENVWVFGGYVKELPQDESEKVD